VKTKRLVCISCLAAAALIASPALSEPQKRSVVTSTSRPQRVAPRTAQVTPTYRHGSSERSGGTGYYRRARNYGSNRYYGATRYYYGGGFAYPYYNSYSYWPYAYYGYYPSSYDEDGPYTYSYYSEPASGYDASLVAQVQERLADLGYYDGVIDGIMGPQTHAGISAYESTHNLVVDGMISSRLLDRMCLS
jgi:hypothetical protein